MAGFTYEVKQHIATIYTAPTFTTELNLISFNGNAPKFDIRRWCVRDGQKVLQKGITLTAEELISLKDALNKLGDITEEGIIDD